MEPPAKQQNKPAQKPQRAPKQKGNNNKNQNNGKKKNYAKAKKSTPTAKWQQTPKPASTAGSGTTQETSSVIPYVPADVAKSTLFPTLVTCSSLTHLRREQKPETFEDCGRGGCDTNHTDCCNTATIDIITSTTCTIHAVIASATGSR